MNKARSKKWRVKQIGSFTATVALSALVVLAAQHLTTARRATAQSDQAQELRASAFVLVGPGGNVLGRFQPGPSANGQLMLLDDGGKTRAVLTGNGSLVVFDADGVTTRFEAGYRLTPGAGGVPPINGVLVDPSGSFDFLPVTP